MIREVVVLGRRGARHAAFSAAELLALGHLRGVDVVVEAADLSASEDDDVDTSAKLRILAEFAERPVDPANKRIVLRFDSVPTAIVGESRVEGLRIAGAGATSASDVLDTPLILRSIGYRGDAIAGLPFDAEAGVVTNRHGRVLDGDRPLTGVYVTGWIKRGARGVIGTNRQDARETVTKIWEDFDAGLLERTLDDDRSMGELLSDRGVKPVDTTGWMAIDTAERDRGAAQQRPRIKFVTVSDMLDATRG